MNAYAMTRDDSTPAPDGWYVKRSTRPPGAWWVCDLCEHVAGCHGLPTFEGCSFGDRIQCCGCDALLPDGWPANPSPADPEDTP